MTKKQVSASQPIGIFDSGIGGLTVAHALVDYLPKENLIYFGDTLHLPYGDKSTSAIQSYASKIADMLLAEDCKLILIACNSASAAAYELVKTRIDQKAIVMNVIDPVIYFIKDKYIQKRIGLIGTRQTVNSLIYKTKIEQLNLGISLSSHATNLLAAAIEEFGDHHLLDKLLEEYLQHPPLQNIDALLLACTHYPIIKNRILKYYENGIEIIDSSDIVAQAVKQQLIQNNLLNTNGTSSKRFYVSDYTESFAKGAQLFFDEKINLEHYPLWDE